VIRRRLFLLSVFAFVVFSYASGGFAGTFSGMSDEEQINAVSAQAGYWAGDITIIKNTDPDAAAEFTFTPTGSGLASTSDFILQDDGTPDTGLSPKKEFLGVLAGVYSFTEQASTTYKLSLIDCSITGGHGSSVKYLGAAVSPTDAFEAGDNKVEITLSGGDAVECTFKNEPVEGNITIVKNTVPDAAQSFEFTSNVSGHTAFSLSDTQQRQMTSLTAPGTYTVTETAFAGYETSDISCTGLTASTASYHGASADSDAFELGDNSVTIELAAGETAVCTFTNSLLPQIRVLKNLNPTTDTGRFDLIINGTTYQNTGNTGYGHGEATDYISVPAGTQTVGESAHASTTTDDYDPSISCDSGKGSNSGQTSLTTGALNYGDQITCTITNNRKPQLSVKKVLDPTNDAGKFDLGIDGSFDDNGGSGFGHNGQTAFETVSTGTHVVAEQAHAGTTLSDYSQAIACDNGKGSNSGQSSLTTGALSYGDRVTCTITNSRKASLTVKKVVTNDDLGDSDPEDFSIHVKLGGVEVAGSPQPGDATTGTTYLLAPGTYVVSETGASGYDLSFSASCPGGSITLTTGQVATCTLTNNDAEPGMLTINKVCAVPAGVIDSGGNKGFFNFFVNAVQKGASNIACGGTTSSFQVPAGVQLTVTETAGNQTDLNDFTTTYGGDCAANATITVASGASKTCTVTNTVKVSVPQRCLDAGISNFDNIYVGTVGVDTIAGQSAKNNLIFGLGGNDTLTGSNKYDCIVGGPGDDTLNGDNSGPEPDVLIGGPGNDHLNGDNGPDYLYGDDGNDVLDGGNNGATCDGGAGTDTGTDCSPSTNIP
jgi:hypothetical protein